MATSVCGRTVTTMSEAAREFGWHLGTVRDLLRSNNIDTYKVKYSPNARGIDRAGMDRLRECAGKGAKPKRSNGVKV